MKVKNSIQKSFKSPLMLLMVLLTSIRVFAQDAPQKVDIDINAGGGNAWYGQPWIWAIGVAIFILILVIVTRSNKSSES